MANFLERYRLLWLAFAVSKLPFVFFYVELLFSFFSKYLAAALRVVKADKGVMGIISSPKKLSRRFQYSENLSQS